MTSSGQLVSSFSDRFAELLRDRPESASELAEKMHVSRQTVSTWKLGTRHPNKITTVAIADFFGVNIEWLYGYDVPKFRDTPVGKRMYATDAMPAALQERENNDIRVLIPGMDKLPEHQRERIINIFRAVFEATYPDLEKKGSENDDT